MKTDLYTKFVLTMIAVSRCIIAVKNLNVTPTVHAQVTPLDAAGAGMSVAIQNAIWLCWDRATISSESPGEWVIRTDCNLLR